MSGNPQTNIGLHANTEAALQAKKVERKWEYFPRFFDEETALFKYEVKVSGTKERKIFFEIVPLRGVNSKDTEFELLYRLRAIDPVSRQKSNKVLQMGETIKFVVGEGKESKKLYISVKKYKPYNLEFEIKPTEKSSVPIIENQTYLKSDQFLDFSPQKGKGGSVKGV